MYMNVYVHAPEYNTNGKIINKNLTDSIYLYLSLEEQDVAPY